MLGKDANVPKNEFDKKIFAKSNRAQRCRFSINGVRSGLCR